MSDTAALPSLNALRDAEILRDIDTQFAKRIATLAAVTDPLVVLGLAVASRAPGSGHICAELDRMHGLVRRERGTEHAATAWPEPTAWAAALRNSPVVGDGDDARPLVLDGTRLYLNRYWRYEARLVRALQDRARVIRTDVDTVLLRDGLERLFGTAMSNDEPDLQRMAACVAALRNLTIITGGPGTGKTTTVVRILALLLEQAQAAAGQKHPLRIALAAPTGKAAARMIEAIRSGTTRLNAEPRIISAIPTAASTIHRLLGVDIHRPTRFRHDAANPLDVDVLVVDEVSMVDLALMAKLIDAVPPDARLILVGDRNQLASVEAGAILDDVCGDADDGMSASFAEQVAAITGARGAAVSPHDSPGLRDCIVRLTKSHRFDTRSAIGRIAHAINQGNADEAIAELTRSDADSGCASLISIENTNSLDAIRHTVLEGYHAFIAASDPETKLRALERFRVLCAHRTGPFGVAALNESITRWLKEDGAVAREADPSSWYHGRPFMVTENDYSLDVFNGDTGVIIHESNHPRAYLWAPGGGIRGLSPARLPAHDTVYAMTIHKSQGSEFDDIVLVLPDAPSPIVTRELVYTGISRARHSVTIVGTATQLRAASSERVQRASGIRARLAPLVV